MNAKAIVFFVPGRPIPQPRPRATVIRTREGARAQVYEPSDSDCKAWKATIRLYAAQHFQDPLWTGPLLLEVGFLMPRPESRELPPGRCRYLGNRGDWDNLAKALCDALNPLPAARMGRGKHAVVVALKRDGVWEDDRHVRSARIDVWYAAVGEEPGAHVRISRLTEQGEQLGLRHSQNAPPGSTTSDLVGWRYKPDVDG